MAMIAGTGPPGIVVQLFGVRPHLALEASAWASASWENLRVHSKINLHFRIFVSDHVWLLCFGSIMMVLGLRIKMLNVCSVLMYYEVNKAKEPRVIKVIDG
jgi:hypothetical protein